MKIKIALLIVCTAFLSLLSSKAAIIQVQVGAGGLKFTPQNVTIQVGDTIEWVWAANGHSTTSGTPGSPDGMWDSGIKSTGFIFSRTFTAGGTFNYYCSPHGSCCGMIGSITVAAAVDTVQISRAQYTTSRSQLTVLATDDNPNANLTVSVTSTGMVLGPMTTTGNGSYSAKFKRIANPVNVTVTSDLGGTASTAVRVK